MLFLLTMLSAARAAETDEKELAELRERIRALEKALDEQRGISDAPAEIPLDLATRVNVYGAIALAQHEEQPVVAFALDELIFNYKANLDRRMSMSTGFSMDVEEDGVVVGLEQMEIQMAPSAAFQVNGGAFHFPLSPWAVTGSEGSYRYLPVEKPEALREEAGGEFLPIDQAGLEVRGKIPAGFWQIGYGVALTNGRAPAPGDSISFGDENYFKAVTVRGELYSPGGIHIGGGVYYDQLGLEDEVRDTIGAEGAISETIATAHFNWAGGPVEVLSEWYITLHGVEGESFSNFNSFAYVGVPIKRTTPFVGTNIVRIDPADPVYAIFDVVEADETEFMAGFRYELGLHLALKGQFDTSFSAGGDPTIGGHLQLAAGF